MKQDRIQTILSRRSGISPLAVLGLVVGGWHIERIFLASAASESAWNGRPVWMFLVWLTALNVILIGSGIVHRRRWLRLRAPIEAMASAAVCH